MKYDLDTFNQLTLSEVQTALFNCCGSTQWVKKLMDHFPFSDERQLFEKACQYWYQDCAESDCLEAFSHHPLIGDKEKLREKFAGTRQWAANEQSGVVGASDSTLERLANQNQAYYDQNGFIFLVFATGKSADEMLHLLDNRLSHRREEELLIAKGEQFKITLLRLQKLIDLEEPFWKEVSHLTTHVLDTSIGTPGKNITIRLKQKTSQGFLTMAIGVTNDDGRIAQLLPPGLRLDPGHYQMCFDTQSYFDSQEITGFYPKVDIDFTVFDHSHYHVPLLINPFGFSTYRGS